MIADSQINRLPAFLHQAPHIGPGNRHQVARAQERVPHGETLHANLPGPAFGIEPDIALLLQGGQQPVHGRWR